MVISISSKDCCTTKEFNYFVENTLNAFDWLWNKFEFIDLNLVLKLCNNQCVIQAGWGDSPTINTPVGANHAVINTKLYVPLATLNFR